MASQKPSPARKGLVGATALFAILTFAGIAWMEHVGELDGLPALGPSWTATGSSGSNSATAPALSAGDAETQDHADRGALVGRGTFPDGNHVHLGTTMFRFWGVRSDDTFGWCQDNTYGWRCGTRARDALAVYTHAGLVACYDRGLSTDGERLGQCFRGSTDLGGLMVENGFAYAVDAETPNYHVTEALARSHNYGIWQTADR